MSKKIDEKPVAVRASVKGLRQSMEVATEFMKAGIAYVCVPYFTEDQKTQAVFMAMSNLSDVDIDAGD